MIYALIFAASFAFVFLKAFQQLNVVRGAYPWVLPTSFAMACCEVYSIAAVAKQGWGFVILPVGLGAGLGAMLAMFLHRKFVRSE